MSEASPTAETVFFINWSKATVIFPKWALGWMFDGLSHVGIEAILIDE